MVFSSTVFLFLFLPVTYLVNLLLPRRFSNYWLLLTSLLFYAWGEPVFVLVMLLSIAANYLFALGISERSPKLYVTLSVVFNLQLLGVFKYTGFVVENINALLGMNIPVPAIRLPIGISFFTFQAMSYCIDVYRRATDVQKNVFKVALYISFFPQLIAGPIVKYHDIAAQIDERSMTIEKTSVGIRRFIVGLAKKVLIANSLGIAADKVFALSPEAVNMPVAWAGAICYAMQIFFDFSGYSDMAIGLGKMFGFDIMENFNYPYISRSVREFWRRWHISLGDWFRENIYIPLGGNRKGIARTCLNVGIVFLLTGLWHGAQWTFVVWGAFHGLFMVLENAGILKTDKWPKPVALCYTLLIAVTGFVMFRADDIAHGANLIASMFAGFRWGMAYRAVLYDILTPTVVVSAVFGALASAPVVPWLKQKLPAKLCSAAGYAASLILLVLCVMSLASSTYNPFIYFRF